MQNKVEGSEDGNRERAETWRTLSIRLEKLFLSCSPAMGAYQLPTELLPSDNAQATLPAITS